MNDLTMEALQQGSADWHALRSRMIGASDAPVIMGLSPWMTPLQLWEQKMGLSENEENWAMFRGKEMEPEARAAYESKTGEIMFPSVEISGEYFWAMASLDGINLERTKIVEIKCPGKEDHDKALKGEIPEKYKVQMQHQMMVVGLNSVDYWSYREGKGVLIIHLRDDKFIEEMLIAEQEFYQYLIDKVPPPLTDRDIVQIDDPVWFDLAHTYFELRAERTKYEKLENEAKDRLIEKCEGKSSKGNGYTFKKSYRKGAIAYDAIPELVLLDLEQYRKPGSVSWTISKAKEE